MSNINCMLPLLIAWNYKQLNAPEKDDWSPSVADCIHYKLVVEHILLLSKKNLVNIFNRSP